MLKKFASVTGIAIFAAATSACLAKQPSNAFPTERLHLKSLMFPQTQPHKKFKLQAGPATFCMANRVKTTAKLSFIDVLAGERRILTYAQDKPCDISVSYNIQDFQADHQIGVCHWKIAGTDKARVNQLNIASTKTADVENCFQRLAMILAGFPGALSLKDEDVFIDRMKTIWAPQVSSMPELVPLAPAWFFACGFDKNSIAEETDIPDYIPCGDLKD